MHYCSHCGSLNIRQTRLPGDHVSRLVCADCGTIHYQNPKIVAGCLAVWETQVLLCRRAIEPRYGLWTLPAGFMENHESTEQAALRETYEEAQAVVTLDGLYAVQSIPHISQVYLLFRGYLARPEFAPGPESLEVRLFHEAEIPWNHLAFPVVVKTLRCYFADRAQGHFGLHVGNIEPTPR